MTKAAAHMSVLHTEGHVVSPSMSGGAVHMKAVQAADCKLEMKVLMSVFENVVTSLSGVYRRAAGERT